MITVLKAGERDIGDLALLSQKCFTTERWSQENFRGALEKGSLVVCARDFDKDEIIGFAVMDIVDREGYIGLIAVDERYRREGVGRSMIWRLLQAADTALLDLRASNGGARAFYTALGFKEIARRPKAYKNPEEDMITMKIVSAEMTSACPHKKEENK